MTIIRQLVIYFAVIIFHWWWGTHWTVDGIAPNIVFVGVMCAAVLYGPVSSHAFGFCWGLYLDILGTSLFGGYALTFTLLVYTVRWFCRQMEIVGPFSHAVMAWIMSVAGMLFYQLLALIFLHELVWRGWEVFFWEPCLNALIMPVVLVILKGVHKKR